LFALQQKVKIAPHGVGTSFLANNQRNMHGGFISILHLGHRHEALRRTSNEAQYRTDEHPQPDSG